MYTAIILHCLHYYKAGHYHHLHLHTTRGGDVVGCLSPEGCGEGEPAGGTRQDPSGILEYRACARVCSTLPGGLL